MPLHKGLSFSNRYADEKLINFIYHTNYCVIRGFLALRKAVTTQVKKFRTFLRQPPPPPSRHSPRYKNDCSQSKVVCIPVSFLSCTSSVREHTRLLCLSGYLGDGRATCAGNFEINHAKKHHTTVFYSRRHRQETMS